MKILEVCTVSHAAYALVSQRVKALNQRHPEQWQITLLCSDGPEVDLMREQGIPVIVTPLERSLNPLRLARSTWRLFRVLREGKYDVVHLHFGIPGLIGRFLALFWRQPIWIYQSHGYSFTEHTNWWGRTIYLWVERLLKPSVRYSLFQLREDMALARRHRLLDEQQMVYIGNGIDLTRFTPQPPTTPDGITVFGMVARFEAVKNHALLLEAVALLAQHTRAFRVKLIGQGKLQTDIETIIRSKGLTDLVEILPYRNDMPAFYHDIDVGILTSVLEGIPRALLEPMACAKPVICTDVKGSREAIIEGVTGFTTPLGEAQQLATRMQWFIDNPVLGQAMGQAAHRHAREHFSEHRVIATLAALYLSLMPQTLLPQPQEAMP